MRHLLFQNYPNRACGVWQKNEFVNKCVLKVLITHQSEMLDISATFYLQCFGENKENKLKEVFEYLYIMKLSAVFNSQIPRKVRYLHVTLVVYETLHGKHTMKIGLNMTHSSTTYTFFQTLKTYAESGLSVSGYINFNKFFRFMFENVCITPSVSLIQI